MGFGGARKYENMYCVARSTRGVTAKHANNAGSEQILE